jgi:hypothetical protein
MDITGKVIQVLPLTAGIGKANGKEWTRQDFIIETDEKYPKKVCITAMNEVANRVFVVGETIKCHLNIESKEFNGKWYSEIKAWKIE